MSNVAIPLFILMIIVILLPLLIGIYVFRDAKRRNMNAPLWTLIAILAPSLIGFIIYLLVRGNYSNLKCPRCETTVTEQFVVCPKCGTKLKPSCPNCATPTEPDWRICPKCTLLLPTVQEDIIPPVYPKDKTLWKILLVIILIPAFLLLAFGISFFPAAGAGSSSLREVSIDDYFHDQELSESTKTYVRDWMYSLGSRTDHAYALRYEYQIDPKHDNKDYYYLVYVPSGGDTGRRGFGYSSGLFGGSIKLELHESSGQDGLYCMMTTSKSGAPKLKVSLNGQELSAEVTEVSFNPTLYTIASETDYSMLAAAAGELYVESEERAMVAKLATFTKYVDGQQYAVAEVDSPDFLLNTVVGIHELHYLNETPEFLREYKLRDYYSISILFIDDTGKYHYEDTCSYLIIAAEGSYYLLEIGMDSQLEDILLAGQVTGDDVLAYEISQDAYTELETFFIKP